MSTTKIEFAVQMSCDSCAESVKKSLSGVNGIKDVDVNLEKGSVVVDTSLSSFDVQKKIESTGRKVVIKGVAGSSAAVAIIESANKEIQGVVRFMQADTKTCIIDGTVDGLSPGQHKLAVHECGDISQGYKTVGDVYNPKGVTVSNGQHYGDLGTVTAEDNGRAAFRLENNVISLADIIGRSLVIQSKADLTGLRAAYGVIARSSGLFQNPKTICACDGISLWDERSKPKWR